VLTAELPSGLRDALAREFPGGASAADAIALSARYRDRASGPGPQARLRADVAAYAATRLPATYAALAAVLGELRDRAPMFAPRSQVDLGAGLGAAVWAAAGLWPSLERTTAVELEPAMLEAGRRLAASGPAVVAACAWRQADARGGPAEETVDLVTIGYLLNELDAAASSQALERAWAATAGALVVVEPGTPDGYRRILAVREQLLGLGGFIVAPCPHDRACPLGEGDWCHFAVRLPRSAAHRAAKAAQAGFEDEKFAYVVAAREEVARASARVLRHPQVRGGHVRLELCAEDGLRNVVVSKRDREAFREARKASWGDAFHGRAT
jgi:ribosomal protein RSM22 (predicted rRNA methylase)